jgi:hypothetical protein
MVSTRLHRPLEQLDEEFDDWLPAIAGEAARLAAETTPRRRARSALL